MSSRWSLVEYEPPKQIVGSIASHLGLPKPHVKELISKCGERAARALGFRSSPITMVGDSVRVVDIAGQIRVAPGIELEVAPKFLGLDADNSSWRQDFFYLATLSRHGRLLALERLRASTSESGDLHTLVARAMVEMYWRNHRRPNRVYRLHSFSDYAYEGEVDPVDVVQPGPDGFVQSSMVFDRKNHHNQVILAAAKYVLPYLRDPGVISEMERVISALSPQKTLQHIPRRVRLPNRARRWQPLYDLSLDVLRGFGLTFNEGGASAPGYLLDTWRVWEDLLTLAAQIGFGSIYCKAQNTKTLGERSRISYDSITQKSEARVTPDISILDDKHSLRFLIDAKYKGRADSSKLRISESDLYESLAFARANNCRLVALAYPALPSQPAELGRVEAFEVISIDDIRIVGVEVDVRGISKRGGLSTFAARFKSDLDKSILRYS